MRFREIRDGIEGVTFDKLRIDNDGYFEAVVVNDELTKLTSRLEKIFGSPVWPSRRPLVSGAERVIRDFGGIRQGQTLYFWNEGQDNLFAMLWPWVDMNHTTVKIVGKN